MITTTSFAFILLSLLSFSFGSSPTFTVDFSSPSTPFPHFWERCVGSGHALLALRRDYQEQLAQIHSDCGFQYVRMHGILDDDVYVNPGPHQFSFINVDLIYSGILEAGMRPIVELSFMPSWLATDPSETVCHYNGIVSPPKNYTAWGELISALVQHLEDRFGAEEIQQWFFENWNEPNSVPFWKGTMEEYFELYATTSRAVKSVDSKVRIGGPTTTQDEEIGGNWITEFLQFTASNNISVDFVSCHSYGTGYDHIVDVIINNITTNRKQVGAEVDLFITEFGSSYYFQDPYHDEFGVASFIAGIIENAQGVVDLISYWTFSDIFEEAGWPTENIPFHNGFGLMNVFGVPKPAYRAYQLFHNVGDEKYAVTVDDDSTFAHVIPLSGGANGTINLVIYNRNLEGQTPDNITINILAQGIKTTPQSVTIARIDSENSNPKQAWLNMGSPNYPTSQQNAAMIQASSIVFKDLAYQQVNGVLQFSDLLIPAEGLAVINISF